MPDLDSSDPLLTVKGLAAREGVPQDTIRNFISRADLPHYRANGIRIRLSEYRAWMDSHKKGAHVDVPTAQSQMQAALAVAQRMAPHLREAGILSVTVPGLSFDMAPAAKVAPAVDSDNDKKEPWQDPLRDSSTYARADGSVPGFKKLREKPSQS